MLAPANGGERFLSVGSGHTTAFCRAAKHGCKTEYALIRDGQGVIDIQKLKRQRDYKIMLEQGWSWRAIPSWVEIIFPKAPDVLQKALNSNHEVRTVSTELEVAISCAETMSGGSSEAEAIEHAISSNPPCASYGKVLCELAKKLGGGVSTPRLYALDVFAKSLGENVRLGETFIQSIVQAKFPDSASFPLVLDSLLAVNLVSTKIIDGVAKTLERTHVQSIQTRSKLPVVVDASAHLQEGERICKLLENEETIDAHELHGHHGMFKVRIGANLCGRGQLTLEGKAFKMPDIIRMFLKEIYSLMSNAGVATNLGLSNAWLEILKTTKDDESTAQKQRGAASEQLLTIEQVESKELLAKQKGFSVGVIVAEKGLTEKSKLYEIVTIGEDVELVESDPFKEEKGLTIKVPFSSFFKSWGIQQNMPQRIDFDWSQRVASKASKLSYDSAKSLIFLALKKHACENEVGPNNVLLCLKPTCLRAKQRFGHGELVLTPLVGLAYLTQKKSPSCVDIGLKAPSEIFITRPAQPKKIDENDWGDDDVVIPYWWAIDNTTNVAKDANLVRKTVNVDGIKFQVLSNSKVVNPMDELKIYKEKASKPALGSATIVEKPTEDGADASVDAADTAKKSVDATGPAKKRARK